MAKIKGMKQDRSESRNPRPTRKRRRGKTRKTLVIEVTGGVVAEVSNLPPGYDYEIVDHDVEESTAEGWLEEGSP